MGIPKFGLSKNKLPMHYTVGAVIKKNGKYLLIERRFFPYGFAGVAGHVDYGENPARTVVKEVREESGLKVTKHKLIIEKEVPGNRCIMGISVHYWYIFDCKVTGKIKGNLFETKSVKFYSVDEIKKLKLEKIWRYWMTKLKII
jgi:ADP-ribose pyrophosphatase YjhB (NUDIX family)